MKQILPFVVLMLVAFSVSAQKRSASMDIGASGKDVPQTALVKTVEANDQHSGGQYDEDGYELALSPLYPNPATDHVVVSGQYLGLPADDFLWLTIMDVYTGEIYYEDYIVVQETIEQYIDLTEVPEGLFVAFFQSTDGKYRTREVLMIRR